MILKSPAPPSLCNSGGHFHVSVVETFDPARHNPVGMLCQRKFNGIRCLIHLRASKEPVYYTKNGRQITGLDHLTKALEPAIKGLAPTSRIIIDGELTLSTADRSDDFNTLVSVLQKKDHIIERPLFRAFDLVPEKAFSDGRWSRLYVERMDYLDLFLFESDQKFFLYDKGERIGSSKGHLQAMIARAVQMGWEGLILRANAPYSGQLTDDVLKIKLWQDTEVPIVGFLTDNQRITSIQVTLFGRSLAFSREQLPPGSLDAFDASPSRLLNAQATIAWDEGKTISNPRIAAIYPDGRQF